MGIKSAFRSSLIGTFVVIGLAFAFAGRAEAQIACNEGFDSTTQTPCTTAGNLTVSGTETVTGDLIVSGNLTVQGTGTIIFGNAVPNLTVNGNLTVADGGILDASGGSGGPGNNLSVTVTGLANVSGLVTTEGVSLGNSTAGARNGGILTLQVAGDLTLSDTGLLESVAAGGNADGVRFGGDVVVDVGGNATIDGLIDSVGAGSNGQRTGDRFGGDVTVTSDGAIDVSPTGFVVSNGAGGGASSPNRNAGAITLLACADITVADFLDPDSAQFHAKGGAKPGDGNDILFHAGGNITLGVDSEYDVSKGGPTGNDGTITFRAGGIVTDNGADFIPAAEPFENGAAAPLHCAVGDDFAKISGGINFGAGPGNSPEYAFDGIVSNGPDGPGSIEINYRLWGPTQCTFTRNAAIVYDGDNSATFTADYLCVNGDKDGQSGTATLTLVDRDVEPPRGAIKVDASDDDLDIDDDGEPVLLETGNVIIDDGV